MSAKRVAPMSATELIKKIEALKELEALIREAERGVEELKEEIKEEMTKQNTEEIIVDRYIVRWTKVSTDRFDSKALKGALPDVYNMYIKTTTSRRFSING